MEHAKRIDGVKKVKGESRKKQKGKENRAGKTSGTGTLLMVAGPADVDDNEMLYDWHCSFSLLLSSCSFQILVFILLLIKHIVRFGSSLNNSVNYHTFTIEI
jgi:hypothetical protein